MISGARESEWCKFKKLEIGALKCSSAVERFNLTCEFKTVQSHLRIQERLLTGPIPPASSSAGGIDILPMMRAIPEVLNLGRAFDDLERGSSIDHTAILRIPNPLECKCQSGQEWSERAHPVRVFRDAVYMESTQAKCARECGVPWSARAKFRTRRRRISWSERGVRRGVAGILSVEAESTVGCGRETLTQRLALQLLDFWRISRTLLDSKGDDALTNIRVSRRLMFFIPRLSSRRHTQNVRFQRAFATGLNKGFSAELKLCQRRALDLLISSSDGSSPGDIRKWALEAEEGLTMAIGDFTKRGILRRPDVSVWSLVTKTPNADSNWFATPTKSWP
ncbi:hypothetical protein B0H16DRAFT_1698804, partial [Mycena metata]